jgi:hypothetical protein
MLHLLQVVLHLVQAVDTLFEMTRQAGEERRNFGVFEVLELGNDVIAFLAGFHPVDKILNSVFAQPEVIDALRKHSGKEERVISDMLANLAFAIERGRRSVDRIRFDEHFTDVSQRPASGVADLEQLLDFAELGHQMRDIVHNLRVADTICLGPPNPASQAVFLVLRDVLSRSCHERK